MLVEARLVSLDEAAVLICRWRQSNVMLQGSTHVSPGLRTGLLTGTGRPGSRAEVRAPEVSFHPVLQALLAWCVNTLGSVTMLCIVPGDPAVCYNTQAEDCDVQGHEAILPLLSADTLGEHHFDFCYRTISPSLFFLPGVL